MGELLEMVIEVDVLQLKVETGFKRVHRGGEFLCTPDILRPFPVSEESFRFSVS